MASWQFGRQMRAGARWSVNGAPAGRRGRVVARNIAEEHDKMVSGRSRPVHEKIGITVPGGTFSPAGGAGLVIWPPGRRGAAGIGVGG